MVEAGSVLWTPSPTRVERARWNCFGKVVDCLDFESMWIHRHRRILESLLGLLRHRGHRAAQAVLGRRTMPGAEWFRRGAQLRQAHAATRAAERDAAA
jgi:hypothetical protein